LRSTKILKKNLLKFNYFLLFSNRFDVLISKIILKNIYYFNTFLSEKYFEKQLLPHSQTRTKKKCHVAWQSADCSSHKQNSVKASLNKELQNSKKRDEG
jgi:hypothetical protein